jgi:hypothetical protein
MQFCFLGRSHWAFLVSLHLLNNLARFWWHVISYPAGFWATAVLWHNCTLHSELLTADHCAFPDWRAWSHARTTRRSAALTQTWHFELISSFSLLPKPCKTIFTILGWTSIILNPSTQIKQFFVASPCSEKPPVQWSLIFYAPWPSWPLQYENNNWHISPTPIH